MQDTGQGTNKAQQQHDQSQSDNQGRQGTRCLSQPCLLGAVSDGSEISRGIFAPTIRYHEGTYYIITTNVDHGGNFVITAQDPKGPWSVPHYLGDAAEGIDPSLFFDEDGKCYYVGTRPNPSGVRHNGDWEIWIEELDLHAMCLKGAGTAVWKGALKDCIWPRSEEHTSNSSHKVQSRMPSSA